MSGVGATAGRPTADLSALAGSEYRVLTVPTVRFLVAIVSRGRAREALVSVAGTNLRPFLREASRTGRAGFNSRK